MARPIKERTVMVRVRISDSKRLKKNAKLKGISIPDYIHKSKWY